MLAAPEIPYENLTDSMHHTIQLNGTSFHEPSEVSLPVCRLLYSICHNYPAIDSHAHPLLRAARRNAAPFEGLISEAEEPALQDSIHTLVCFRATAYLSQLFGLKGPDAVWDQVKIAREQMSYENLCTLSFKSTKIQCILIDDGLELEGSDKVAEGYKWHDKYTTSPTKRVLRIETAAEVYFSHLHVHLVAVDLFYIS